MATEMATADAGGYELLVQLEQSGALSSIGLNLTDPNISYERYEAIGALLGRMHQSLRFAIGDWLRIGEHLFSERFYQAAEVLGLSEKGMMEYVRVSTRVPRSTRRKDLSWSHHRAVASLSPLEQREWLRMASTQGMSHHALRDALRPVMEDVKPEVCSCCGKSL